MRKSKRKPYFGNYYKNKAFSGKISEWYKGLDRAKYEYNLHFKYNTEESLSKLYASLNLSRYRTFTGFHAELMQWYPELKKFTTANAFKAFDSDTQREYLEDLERWKRANPSATGAQLDEYTERLLNKYASEQSPLYKEVYEKALQRWKIYQQREKLMISGQYQYYRSENYREQYTKQLEAIGVEKKYIDALKRVSPEKWYEYATMPNNKITDSSMKLLPVLGSFYIAPELITNDSAYVKEVTEKLINFFNTMGIDVDQSPTASAESVLLTGNTPEVTFTKAKKAYKKTSGMSLDKYYSYYRLYESVSDPQLKNILRTLPYSVRRGLRISEDTIKYATNPRTVKQIKFSFLEIRENKGLLKPVTSTRGKVYIPFVANSKLYSEYLQWRARRQKK